MMSESNKGIGLSIQVTLDDTEAKSSLDQLLKNNAIQLTINSEALTQIESQMKKLSDLQFDKLLNESTLAQFEHMTTQLESQLASVQAMKQAFSEMKIPTGASGYNKNQQNLYEEAADLQKTIFEEEEKINSVLDKENKYRRENVAVLKEHLDVLKSQITDQQLLVRLESQLKAVKASYSNHQMDEAASKKAIKQKKDETEAVKQANAEQVDSYKMISAINNEIFQQSKKLMSATRSEQPVISGYIKSLKQAKTEIQSILEESGLTNARKETMEYFNEILRDGKLQVEQAHQQALAEKKVSDEVERENKAHDRTVKLNSEKAKKLAAEARSRKELVELTKKEYEIKLKSLTNGRNGNYVDQYGLAALKKHLDDLNSKTSTENLRKQIRNLSLEFRELSVNANVARQQQTGGFIDSLNKSFQNLAKYVTGAMIIRQFFTELRQGVQYVRELDSAMTTLRMTMSEFSERDITKLIDKSVELSKTLKANVSDVLEALKTVANAEETMESIMNKTKSAVILSNLGGDSVSIGDAVNMIQSATRQFDDLKDASEASTMAVADSMIAISKSLGMDFAEGLNGLSEGITILGSVANQFGMDLNQTLSLMAATAETTRASFSETVN